MDIVKHNGDETFGLAGEAGGVSNPGIEVDADSGVMVSGVRSKSSMRIHYEAQVEVIRKQIGGLEAVRLQLGLSQRKMCQLLMVDPSAWTRWCKNEAAVPPLVWRSLQWFLVIQEKIPGLTPQYFVGKDPAVLHREAIQLLEEESKIRQNWATHLAEELERQNDKWIEQNAEIFEAKKSLQSEIDHLKKKLRIYQWLMAVAFLFVLAFVISNVSLHL